MKWLHSLGHFSIQTSCQWVKLKSNKLRMIHENEEPQNWKKNWTSNKHRTKLSVMICFTHHKKKLKKKKQQRNTTNLFHASLVSSHTMFMPVAGLSTPQSENFTSLLLSMFTFTTCYLVIEFSAFFSFYFIFISYHSVQYEKWTFQLSSWPVGIPVAFWHIFHFCVCTASFSLSVAQHNSRFYFCRSVAFSLSCYWKVFCRQKVTISRFQHAHTHHFLQLSSIARETKANEKIKKWNEQTNTKAMNGTADTGHWTRTKWMANIQ